MITLLLPAYNEAVNLKAMFEFLAKHPVVDKVLVVDDGSTDETVSLVEGFCRSLVRPVIEIVRHEKNQGLGAALRTGIRHLCPKLLPDDIVITMDSDNTHPLDIIPLMCEKIQRGADLVIASRFCPGGKEFGVPLTRRILSCGLRLLVNILLSAEDVTDYSSGCRAFRGAVIKKLYDRHGEDIITEAGFTGVLELLFKLIALKIEVNEVPLILRYDRKVGKSKIRVMSTVVSDIWLLVRMLLKR